MQPSTFRSAATAPTLSAPIRAVLLVAVWATAAAGLIAQTNVTGPYDSESFEAPRYALGTLPGLGFADGQDGWMLFDSLALVPNLGAATVQNSVARSGRRAIRFDAAALTPHCFGELRRNAMLNLTTGAIEIDMDFLITSSPNPSSYWSVYTQPAPHPGTCQLIWYISSTGFVEYLSTTAHTLIQTGFFVGRDVWHHARTVVDPLRDRTEIHIDGALVATGQVMAPFPGFGVHGFTQIDVENAGNDAFFFDNLQIRERTAVPGLSVDLEHLPIGQRSVATFQLEGGPALAGRAYALLGSFAGTTPGLTVGASVLPLNPDWFFDLCAANLGSASLPGFLGTFNADGHAEAVIDSQIPVPAALLGQSANFAYVTLNPFDAVSPPVRCRITL